MNKYRNIYIGSLFSLVIILAILGAVSIALVCLMPAEKRYQLINIAFLVDGTRQSPEFTESMFESVIIGDAKRELLAKIGTPLYTYKNCRGRKVNYSEINCKLENVQSEDDTCSDSEEVFMYAHQGDPTKNYRIRGVVIKDDKVMEKLYYFEYD